MFALHCVLCVYVSVRVCVRVCVCACVCCVCAVCVHVPGFKAVGCYELSVDACYCTLGQTNYTAPYSGS